MNRRNFLKLFGIFAVPSSVLALPAPATKKGNITVITSAYDWYVILVNGESNKPYSRRKGYATDYHRSDMMGLTYHPMKVSENDVITVQTTNGVGVSFKPQWNTVDKRFETVAIEMETYHDIFMGDDDTTILERKHTTICARNDDGELITKSVWGMNV